MTTWDVFVSHAREDKSSIALPVAEGLAAAGLKVWIDREELRLGDSLRRRIEDGLLNARFGVVILSPAFLGKEWPQRELEAILALEMTHGKRILPILHDLDYETLLRKAPLLADRFAISTSDGVSVVVREILRAVGGDVTPVASVGPFDSPKRLVGTVINGYGLSDLVGSGGSGSVYVATHPQQRRSLAFKLFFPLKQGYRHLIGLFERGFRAVKAVRHPNVATLLDSGYCDIDGLRTAFMVTDFVEGRRLDDWSATVGDDEQAHIARLEVAFALSDALATCHATTYIDEFGFQVQGVLHGDLKPANILVDERGSPSVIDFLQVDVQRLIDPRIVPSQVIEPVPSTAACGTPGFMAPEQERHGVVTQATDVYGLGITLTHLFAGPRRNTVFGFMQNTRVSDDLRSLVFSMISEDVAERPRRMTDVHASLTAMLRARRG